MIGGMDTHENLILALADIGAIRFGRFELHSGKISPIYIDLRLLISAPSVLHQAATAYTNLLADLKYDLLAAIPYAGLPLGIAIALHTDQPLIFPRKSAKSYGTGKLIEGKWEVGQTAVIIEDLVTSGDSILQGVAMLKGAGLEIQDAVVLIDRQQGGFDNLRNAGYRPHSVFKLRHILAVLEQNQRITLTQRTHIINALQLEDS